MGLSLVATLGGLFYSWVVWFWEVAFAGRTSRGLRFVLFRPGDGKFIFLFETSSVLGRGASRCVFNENVVAIYGVTCSFVFMRFH